MEGSSLCIAVLIIALVVLLCCQGAESFKARKMKRVIVESPEYQQKRAHNDINRLISALKKLPKPTPGAGYAINGELKQAIAFLHYNDSSKLDASLKRFSGPLAEYARTFKSGISSPEFLVMLIEKSPALVEKSLPAYVQHGGAKSDLHTFIHNLNATIAKVPHWQQKRRIIFSTDKETKVVYKDIGKKKPSKQHRHPMRPHKHPNKPHKLHQLRHAKHL